MQCAERMIVLLWCHGDGKHCPCDEDKVRRPTLISTLIPLWTSCGRILNTRGCLASSQDDVKTPSSPRSSSLSLFLAGVLSSEAEVIVPEWAEVVGNVSVCSVPVAFTEQILGSHPNVQDLGVSTRHCQSEEEHTSRSEYGTFVPLC